MHWCLVIALAGCNQVFDIGTTALGDDNAPPMNPTCPALDAGPPLFRAAAHEVTTRDCINYTTSAATGRALAMCFDGGQTTFEEGPIDGPLAPVELLDADADVQRMMPGLAPEGSALVLRHFCPGDYRVAWYTRTGSAWTYTRDIVTSTATLAHGVPSAAPDRRILVGNADGVREFAEANDAWTVVATHSWASLGITGELGSTLNLSPDALRFTFVHQDVAMYAERASRDLPFGPAVELATVGEVRTPFLTADCGAIYYSGLAAVLRRYQL